MNSLTTFTNIFPMTDVIVSKSTLHSQFKGEIQSYPRDMYSTAIFNALWTHATDAMRLTDERGIILAVNKSFCDLVEMKEHELVGKLFTVVYPLVEDRERYLSTYQTVFMTGLYQTVFESRRVLRSGKTPDIETSAVFVDSENEGKMLLTQFHNITERRKTERILQESEAKYRGLFANSIQPMFESTVTGKILNANKSFLRLMGYHSFGEIVDLNIQHDLSVHDDTYKDVVTILGTRGYIRNIEIQFKRKNGKIITVVENARALYDETGDMIGIEGVLEDITAKKSLEQKLHTTMQALEESKHRLLDLNVQKNKFLSILSHDVRSPFACIFGFCKLLIENDKILSSAKRIQFIEFIQEAAQDQLGTVNNLLDWTRIESGRMHTDFRDLDLHEIIHKSMNSLLGSAYQKEIHLLNKVPRKIFLHGDHQLLLQLFTNLIGNALKFTHGGGRIFMELLQEEADLWTVAVRDTGIGIPEVDLPKLFKIEEHYTKEGLNGERGSGLGLSVCQEIVHKHHGTISVQSTPGKGTSFIIQFSKVSIQPGKVILIVDDEYGARILHSKYIRQVLPEAQIIHASDGEEAFHLAQELRPVLILTDQGMPNVNGSELLKRLKEDPSTKEIPIIFVTSHDSHMMRDTLTIFGVTTILRKPVSLEQFEEVLSHMKTKGVS
jgi:PAS domain S-box-containing protein